MTPPAETDQFTCTRCGEVGSGRFCQGCGAPQGDVACATCGESLVAGARFCNHCGANTVSVVDTMRRRPDAAFGKFMAAAAVLVLIAFVAGQMTRFLQGPSAAVAQAGSPQAGAVSAPDISNMTPEERAMRLFNRVMAYSEQGKMDSARFFAPMAIQAYQMLGPLTIHSRYDIGAIAAAVGEAAMARLEADSILAAAPKHLLGLALAIRASTLAGDSAAATAFRRRLVAAAPSERKRDVKEYTEHAHDIDEALKTPGGSL